MGSPVTVKRKAVEMLVTDVERTLGEQREGREAFRSLLRAERTEVTRHQRAQEDLQHVTERGQVAAEPGTRLEVLRARDQELCAAADAFFASAQLQLEEAPLSDDGSPERQPCAASAAGPALLRQAASCRRSRPKPAARESADASAGPETPTPFCEHSVQNVRVALQQAERNARAAKQWQDAAEAAAAGSALLRRDLEARAAELADARASRDAAAAAADAAARFAQSGVGAALAEHEAALAALSREHAAALKQQQTDAEERLAALQAKHDATQAQCVTLDRQLQERASDLRACEAELAELHEEHKCVGDARRAADAAAAELRTRVEQGEKTLAAVTTARENTAEGLIAAAAAAATRDAEARLGEARAAAAAAEAARGHAAAELAEAKQAAAVARAEHTAEVARLERELERARAAAHPLRHAQAAPIGGLGDATQIRSQRGNVAPAPPDAGDGGGAHSCLLSEDWGTHAESSDAVLTEARAGGAAASGPPGRGGAQSTMRVVDALAQSLLPQPAAQRRGVRGSPDGAAAGVATRAARDDDVSAGGYSGTFDPAGSVAVASDGGVSPVQSLPRGHRGSEAGGAVALSTSPVKAPGSRRRRRGGTRSASPKPPAAAPVAPADGAAAAAQAGGANTSKKARAKPPSAKGSADKVQRGAAPLKEVAEARAAPEFDADGGAAPGRRARRSCRAVAGAYDDSMPDSRDILQPGDPGVGRKRRKSRGAAADAPVGTPPAADTSEAPPARRPRKGAAKGVVAEDAVPSTAGSPCAGPASERACESGKERSAAPPLGSGGAAAAGEPTASSPAPAQVAAGGAAGRQARKARGHAPAVPASPDEAQDARGGGAGSGDVGTEALEPPELVLPPPDGGDGGGAGMAVWESGEEGATPGGTPEAIAGATAAAARALAPRAVGAPPAHVNRAAAPRQLTADAAKACPAASAMSAAFAAPRRDPGAAAIVRNPLASITTEVLEAAKAGRAASSSGGGASWSLRLDALCESRAQQMARKKKMKPSALARSRHVASRHVVEPPADFFPTQPRARR